MIVRFFNWLRAVYRNIVSSLGFWPTIITGAYATLAVLLIWLDTNKITTFLLDKTPALVIKDGDTARVILSTVVGGLVSLTVFSFTMVMAQLNRAATNYSPRLLPGLISTRSHQIVLGTFLGVITFCLLVLITVEPSDDSYELPGLAILVSVIFAIGCLGIFVYFIHSISQAIQVSNILERIATDTEIRLDKLAGDERRNQERGAPKIENAHVISSNKTGYFQGANMRSLKSIAKKEELLIEVIPLQGQFVLSNTELIRLNKPIDDETTEELRSCFTFSATGFVHEDYTLGFQHITEIAVRAMSPGTNDPGTALTAIDHLTHLLARRLRFDDEEVHYGDNNEPIVIISVVSFKDLLYPHLASLRLYCKHDVVIVMKLVRMFNYLLQQPMNKDEYRQILCDELDTLMENARESIKTKADLSVLEEKVDALSCSEEGRTR